MKTVKNKITLLYLLTYGLLIFILCTFLYNEIKEIEYRRINNSLQHFNDDILRAIELSESENLIALAGSEELGFIIYVDNELKAVFRSDLKIHEEKYDGYGENDEYRYLKTTRIMDGQRYELFTTYDLEESKNVLRGILLVIILLSFLTVLGISIIGNIFTGRLLSPLNTIGKQMEEIGKHREPERRVFVKSTGEEIEKLQVEINHSLDEIERLVKETKNISARIAHQFRTPLSVLKSDIQLALQSEKTKKNYTKILEENLTEVNKLNQLTTNFLIISKIESGILEKKKEFDLSELVLEIVERNIIVHENIEFKIDVEPEVIINGIKNLIEAALENMIDNASKYTSNGKVKVKLFRNGSAEIEISNAGDRIPDEIFSEIFKDHIRETGTGRPGFGFGLSVVKEIMELHNSDVNYKYENGRNIFSVQFFI